MLKILLQPLVENSIYHGIKETRRAGLIRLEGKSQDNCLVFTVEDNGLGMDETELKKLRENLSRYDVSNPEMGFGLYNVYKRISHYQNEDGLIVESESTKEARHPRCHDQGPSPCRSTKKRVSSIRSFW